MKSIFLFVIAVASIINIIACRSTKTLTKTMVKKDTVVVSTPRDSHADSVAYMQEVYKGLQGHHISFNTFSGKMKVNFDDSRGKNNDFNAFIRVKKDSIIWVSINAALGIEAFRILITPDSVKVLNKLDKVVQFRSLSYLQEITQLPIDFHTLQDVIIGNPVFFDRNNIVSVKIGDNSISLTSI